MDPLKAADRESQAQASRVMEWARDLYEENPDWVQFHAAVWGPGGALEVVFPERDRRQAFFGSDHGWRPTPVMARRDLTDELLAGPLSIEEYDTTTVVLPGWSVQRDDWNNIVLERANGQSVDP